MNDPNSTMASYERHRQAQAKVNEGNKRALFDALAAANITAVHVEFDGEGDDGQIGSVIALRGEDQTVLPGTTITIREIEWRATDAVSAEMKVEDAIETVCYACLEERHDGWEIDAGAYGEFRFDVATRTISLEFNARYTDIHTSSHTF
jgi:hypothetical protein